MSRQCDYLMCSEKASFRIVIEALDSENNGEAEVFTCRPHYFMCVQHPIIIEITMRKVEETHREILESPDFTEEQKEAMTDIIEIARKIVGKE